MLPCSVASKRELNGLVAAGQPAALSYGPRCGGAVASCQWKLSVLEPILCLNPISLEALRRVLFIQGIPEQCVHTLTADTAQVRSLSFQI